MFYYAYSYHNANTEPVGSTDDNIFGVELEIDDTRQEVGAILDLAIEDNIITVPDNEMETQQLKVMEDDSSVWKEIILRADTKEEIFKRIDCLNEWGLNPDNIENTAGTSCHIHINRQYLENEGITERNIFKLFELWQPVIYAVSGRTLYEFERWADPQTRIKTGFIDWSRHARELEHVAPNHGNRYNMVNCTNSNTIELRAFSNKCSFNPEEIKFYIDLVDFAISTAYYMKGKYYRDEWQNLLQMLEDWIIAEHPGIYQKYALTFKFHPVSMIKIYYALDIFNNQVKRHITPALNGDWYSIGALLWTNREILQRVTISQTGLKHAIKTLENHYYKLVQYEVNAKKYQLTHAQLIGGL